jgi:glycosyltransferase involved in cell wall biosynthesis
MKIAFIGQKGIPTKQGGIEKHVEELSIRLAKAGFDVTVYSRPYYTNNRQKTYFYNGVRVINLPSLKTKNLDAITHTFISTIHALLQNYDIIHYHGVGPALLSWLPRIFRPQIKVISTFHCIDRQHQKWSSFAKLMLACGEWAACHFPHQTITVSRVLQKYCRYRFDRETTYIPNGVDVSFAQTNEEILKQFDLLKNNYILVVSRLIQHKGIHTLIKAYQKIATGKKLVIVGDGANTDNYVTHLRELAQNNPNIVFTGQKSGADLQTLFQNAYLFVQSSEAEGLSIALLEAIAYGLPVLASDIEENQEVLGDQGLNFISKNDSDLADKLQFALNNPQTIRQLANQAQREINQKYNWKDIAGQTIELYQKEAAVKLADHKI